MNSDVFMDFSEKLQLVQEVKISSGVVIIPCHLFMFRCKREQRQGPGVPTACSSQELQCRAGESKRPMELVPPGSPLGRLFLQKEGVS